MSCATTIDNRSSDYPVVVEDHYFAADCRSFRKVVRGQNSLKNQRGMVCQIKCVEQQMQTPQVDIDKALQEIQINDTDVQVQESEQAVVFV